MQPVNLLVLATSCLFVLVYTGDVNLNKKNDRHERSSDLFVDAPESVSTATDQERKLLALAVKNQDGKLDGYSQQISEDILEGSTSSHGNGEIGLRGHLADKRFSEFIGKRNGLQDQEVSVHSEDSGLIDKEVTDNLALTNLIGGLYKELSKDRATKREYEFVGKRNYDFVGKKRYDFLGKRNMYDFIGKRYDFLGKRSPYEFVGKKRYDFIGKRSPYEFVGKRFGNDDAIEGNFISNQFSTSGNQNLHLSRFVDLPLVQEGRDFGDIDKRYSEFLGKRKRNDENEDTSLSNSERLAALLQNNGLRKRLSRMLLNHRLEDNYPGFVGK